MSSQRGDRRACSRSRASSSRRASAGPAPGGSIEIGCPARPRPSPRRRRRPRDLAQRAPRRVTLLAVPTNDVVIIGGGVSGLGFAFHAARAGRAVRVIEEEARVGGCLDTRTSAEGFWL